MQKRTRFMQAVILIMVMFLSSCGALFLGEDEKEIVGFWKSDSWNSTEEAPGSDVCYYDFRDNGEVYVTDYTKDMIFYNSWLLPVPVSFNYSISDGLLTLSQFFGITKIEFNTASSFASDELELKVYTTTTDYLRFEDTGNTLTLTRVLDYTEQDEAARAFLKGFGDE